MEYHRPAGVPKRYKTPTTKAWKALRAQVLIRDACACVRCGRVDPKAQVDHIVPKREGGRDEVWNLQTLCLKCHTKKTALGG